MSKRRFLGLDVGTVTLGITISRTGIIASGLEEFRYPQGEWHIPLQEVVRLVKLEGITSLVIGLPLNMDGSESVMSKTVREFVKMIKDELPEIEIIFEDERNSTENATSLLLEGDLSRKKRKKVIDKVAAQLILDQYLERGNN